MKNRTRGLDINRLGGGLSICIQTPSPFPDLLSVGRLKLLLFLMINLDPRRTRRLEQPLPLIIALAG